MFHDQISNGDQSWPFLVKQFLPAGFVGLVLAASLTGAAFGFAQVGMGDDLANAPGGVFGLLWSRPGQGTLFVAAPLACLLVFS